MARPHPAIASVAEALCLLFGISADTSKGDPNWWAPCVAKLMADPKEMLQKISNYDKDNLSATVAEAVKKVAERPEF